MKTNTTQAGFFRLHIAWVLLASILLPVSSVSAQEVPLVNVSSRTFVAKGKTFTAGFVIGGTSPKLVLIRGAGPSLEAFGVADYLPNPRVTLYSSSGKAVHYNDDWHTPGKMDGVTTDTAVVLGIGSLAELSLATASVGAFTLKPWTSEGNALDAAMLVLLPPGAYTVGLRSATGNDSKFPDMEGEALIEVYSVDPAKALR